MTDTKRRQCSRFLGRGPNGRNLCFCGCAREVVRPRLNWFSDQCVNDWRDRNDPVRIRGNVLTRDNGICAHCGTDCAAIERTNEQRTPDWIAVAREESKVMKHGIIEMLTHQRDYVRDRRKEIGCAHDGHAWEADHIRPVIEGGGGDCGLDNYRTLCLRCHKVETKALAGRRALARAAAKIAQSGIT